MLHSSICVVLCVWMFAITDAAEPSHFLVPKWKAWFNAIDVDHNGYLTSFDADEFIDIFLDWNQMTEGQAATARAALGNWWTGCNQHGQASISEWEFVDEYTKRYSADPYFFKTDMGLCYNAVVRIFDVNEDAAISESEFLIWTKSFDLALSQTFQPIDGKVPVVDFVDFYVSLVSGENNDI